MVTTATYCSTLLVLLSNFLACNLFEALISVLCLKGALIEKDFFSLCITVSWTVT